MMLSAEEIQLYDRQIRVKDFGITGQEKLKSARVLVIGAGGLACPLLQYLCAAGIGEISVCDGDTVSISNLQRQILYNKNDIGKFKVDVALDKLKTINSNIKLNALRFFLDADNAFKHFEEKDLVIDCSDNFGTRYLVNDVCCLLGIPFVSAALFQKEAQLGVFNVKLQDAFSASYRDAFPENDKNTQALDCNTAGVISTLPGIMGLYQANECIKYFINPELSPINQIIFIDSWNLQLKSFKIIPAGENKFSKEEILKHNYSIPCASEKNNILNDIELEQLLENNTSVLFVDVREINEQPHFKHENILQIPLSVFQTNLHTIPDTANIVFVCKAGARSLKAMEIFKSFRPTQNCFSYHKGMTVLIQNNFLQKSHV